MNIGEILAKTSRWHTLVMSLGVIIAATACAALRGEMEFLPASICLLFAMVTQMTGNFYYYYADASSGLGEAIDDSLFNRNANSETVKTICRAAATASLIVSLTLGFTMFAMAGWWTLVPAAVIYGLIYLNYTTPALLSSRPFGFLVPLFLFGIVGIGPAAMMQVEYENPDPFAWYYVSPMVFTTIAMGFLGANSLLVYNFCHLRHDIDNCRNTFTVRYGKPATSNLVGIFGMLYMVLITVFVFTQHVRCPWVALGVAVIPFAINTYVTWRLKDPDITERQTLNLTRLCMANYVLSSLLMLTIALIFGDDDRSRIMYINGWF
ncbi:MAG: prenyltransferase [Muribaculum sp.]|nr:prenyltransferase [Muribaculum sp.]